CEGDRLAEVVPGKLVPSAETVAVVRSVVALRTRRLQRSGVLIHEAQSPLGVGPWPNSPPNLRTQPHVHPHARALREREATGKRRSPSMCRSLAVVALSTQG